ncbi:hypothetical protein [Mucilaginibacter sp.]
MVKVLGNQLFAIPEQGGQWLRNVHPIRACEAIIAAVESDAPYLRLLLGKMAYDLAVAKTETLKENFSYWQDLSLGADFPDGE